MSSLPSDVHTGVLPESGAFLLSALFNCVLFGVLSVQIYIYHLAFPKDPRLTKNLVNGIYLLELFETIVNIYNSYTMLSVRFGDQKVFTERLLVWVLPITVSIVTFGVHCYYAHCIKIISQSWKVPCVILLFTTMQLVGGISTGVFLYIRGITLSPTALHFKKAMNYGFWHSGSALSDIIIAVAMIYYLKRSTSIMRRTQLLLKRLVRLTVETGLITAVVTVVCIILMMKANHSNFNQIYIGFVGKLYANSLLVLVNSRLKLGSDNEGRRSELYVSTAQLYSSQEEHSTKIGENRFSFKHTSKLVPVNALTELRSPTRTQFSKTESVSSKAEA